MQNVLRSIPRIIDDLGELKMHSLVEIIQKVRTVLITYNIYY